MKSSINVKAISGFAEYLPNEQIVFSEIKNLISVFFKRNGFIPLDTSVIERAEVLFAKEGGETAKQVYMVKNKNSDKDDEFALRFDHTVPFARYVANNYSKLTFPFARYAIGKVYRGERAQKGRYREFYQADFDIVSNKMSAGSDIIHASYAYYLLKEILSFLGKDALKQKFILHVSNRKILNGICNFLNLPQNLHIEVLRIIDKIRKVDKDTIFSMMSDIGINQDISKEIFDIVMTDGNNSEVLQKLNNSKFIDNNDFKQAVDELNKFEEFNVTSGEQIFKIDLSITRGLDYYTGNVIETFFDDFQEFGSCFSGGRYDDLVDAYSGQKLIGFGMSLGLTRFFDMILYWNEKGIIDLNNLSINDNSILIAFVGNDIDIDIYNKIISVLNNTTAKVITTMQFSKIDKAYSYAEEKDIQIIIVFEESKKQFIKVKNLKSSEAVMIDIELIKDNLSNEIFKMFK